MASKNQYVELFEMDTWRISQQLLGDPAFNTVADDLERLFHGPIADPHFLLSLEPSKFNKITTAISTAIENKVRDFNHILYQKICVDFQWCSRRDRPEIENAEILATILDVVATQGAAVLSVFLIKRKFFDRLCNCSKSMPR